MDPNDAQNLAPQTVPAALRLDIEVTDPETVAALIHHSDGRDRNEFARQALKIGVIALRHAQGQIDVDAVRREGERLVKDLASALEGHKSTTEAAMVAALKTYFDPSDGRFTERVERLVKKDGELERVMQQQLGHAKQQLEGVLAQFTGVDSGLAKLLTPDEVMRRASDTGDIADAVSNTVGIVPRSKVGDLVITLGPDSAAAGARIVVEAKEDASYTLKSTLDEIDIARKNRAAQVGLFIHSRKTAPASMKPLIRHGEDILIVWDAEDEKSDVVLEAGLAVARALCVRATVASVQTTADLQEMAKALNGIEQQIEKLGDIRTKTATIKSATESINSSTETMEKDLRRRLDVLRDVVSALISSSVSEKV